MTLAIPQRLRWALLYRLGRTPWDTGLTPPELTAEIQLHQPGRFLDIGCGTGTNCVHLAQKGWHCVGLDWNAQALRTGRHRAEGLEVTFVRADVTRLSELDLGDRFDLAMDLGCFHSIAGERRSAYIQGLLRQLSSRAAFLLYARFATLSGQRRFGLDKQQVIDLFSPYFELDWVEDGKEVPCSSAWYRWERRADVPPGAVGL